MKNRLKIPYTPLHRTSELRIDDKGFIYIGMVKICRYNDGALSFQDRRGGSGQGKRFVEISPVRLAAELIRITETLT